MSGKDTDGKESPLFEDAEKRLQLLFDHERNQQLLADWLSQNYVVETPATPALDETIDLCLVDEETFVRHQEALQDWKRQGDPVFTPVLLVSEQSVSDRFDPDEWQTIDGLYIVDDIISMPIEKPVLHRRMANLLERRTLSKTLDLQYRQSKERFSSLFTTLPDPAFVADEDGTLQLVNDVFGEWCGVDPDEVTGRPISSLDALEQPAIDRLDASIQRVLSGDHSDASDIELDLPDGETRHAELNATATAIDGNQFVTVVLRDTTSRVAKEARLAESEHRFRQIATHINEIIWMVDADGQLRYISPGYEELTGRSIGPLPVNAISTAVEHIHPEDRDRLTDEFEALAKDLDSDEWREEYTFEYRLVCADGSIRWIETSAYPAVTPADGSTRVVGILEDITERKHRQRELEQQNERLNKFAGIISHDLRNPLQIVDARIDMLAEGTGDSTEHVEAIQNASDRMDSLIDDLLSLSQAGEAVSAIEQVELSTVARRAWKTIDAPTATFHVESDIVIDADRSRLKQLFENLFRNAIEHGSQDGQSSSQSDDGVTIWVGALDDGFFVADDGPGIPSSKREQVFEEWYSTDDGGTGLGLNIVDDIVSAHGWVVTITESDEDGARFEITGVESH